MLKPYLLAFTLWCALFLHSATAAVPEDRITALPGLKGTLGVQYSGYINIGDGKHMHYVFAESPGNATAKPLVVWLNGGPGCSSLDGYLYEHGPFWFDSDEAKALVPNPYTWLKEVNLLFLESPAGVGFSYSDKDYAPSDNSTADDNYHFLKTWYTKYPEFSQNDLYVTGESYGGVYVPMLSYRCAMDKSMNFKGMAVGNGLTDWDMPEMVNEALYLYKIGATSQYQWNAIVQACKDGEQNKDCQHALDAGSKTFAGYNIYNVYGDCYSQRPPPRGRNLRSFVNGSNTVGEIPPCLDAFAAQTYLNRADVQQALHVKPLQWDICSESTGRKWVQTRRSLKKEYQYLMENGFRILVYNGDNDAACPYTGNEYFINTILKGRWLGQSWRPWTYASTVGSQVGGHVTYYHNGLTFTTVRGAGHMVPQYKPQAAYHMFTKWINGQPL